MMMLTKRALKLQGEGYRLQEMRKLAREAAAMELRKRLSAYSVKPGAIVRAIARGNKVMLLEGGK